MKTISFAALVASLALSNAFADSTCQAPKAFTCADVYQRTANYLSGNPDLRKNLAKSGGLASAGLGVAFTLSPPAGAVLFMLGWLKAAKTAVGLFLKPAPEKVLEITEEGKRWHKKVMNKAHETDPKFSNANLDQIMNEGFETGEFCKNFPELMKPKEVEKYVLNMVSSKSYGHVNTGDVKQVSSDTQGSTNFDKGKTEASPAK